jgi:hypothetical protein
MTLEKLDTRRDLVPDDEEAPRLGDALTRVVDAGERLASRQLELAVLELRAAIAEVREAAQRALAAGVIAGSAWVFAMVALVAWLEGFWPRSAAIAAVAALQFVFAIALRLRNRKGLRGTAE